jgi:predicted nucleic acid-binding protein
MKLLSAFEHIPLDIQTADILGQLLAHNIQNGTKKPLADSIILATAIQHNIDALITENKKDFQNTLFTGKVISLNEL